jgi:hypothetical protein
MDEVRQAAGLLAQLGDNADEVAGSLKASGIQGIRNTARFLNPIVRHLQAQIVGTSEMNLIKGNQLSIALRDGRKVDIPLPLAVNYQCWVAVADADADFARRLRRGSGADLGASGASRMSGSLNFKEKYAPAFPRVETVHASPGRVVTRSELEALGLVAPAEPLLPIPPARVSHSSSSRRWPSYQRCLENPPAARGGSRPDVSRADFTWCRIALDWGFSIEETAARLIDESPKAKESGEAYALRTARSAAAALARRHSRER